MSNAKRENNKICLKPIEYGTVPDVLLLGNGICQLSGGKSWDAVIEDIQKKWMPERDYKDLRILPSNMQVVAATGDNVDLGMKDLAESLQTTALSETQIEIIGEILQLPVGTILTTNYSYEIENCIVDEYSPGKHRKATQIIESEMFNSKRTWLNQYNAMVYKGSERNIWHIHGQVYKKNSLIMGHYYYGKLLSDIQRYLQYFHGRITRSQNEHTSFQPYSWVDYFLLGNVHFVGFGMDFSETDIWWLLCHKKRRELGNVTYYDAEIADEKHLMLDNYNVRTPLVCLHEDSNGNKDYAMFYKEVVDRIRVAIGKT